MCENNGNITVLVADIVGAYLSNQTLAATELPALIEGVHAALATLDGSGGKQDVAPSLTHAQIRKSITPDHIICFENGKSYRSLTRHLRSAYGLSPEEYRAKWGLPHDYPMVAPNYAALRSQLARNIGLGAIRIGKGADEVRRERLKA